MTGWRRGAAGALLGASWLAGCDGDRPVEPPVSPAPPVTLAPFERATVVADAITGGWTVTTPGRYAVLPQFAADSDYSRDGADTVPAISYFVSGTAGAPVAAMAGAPRPAVRTVRTIAERQAQLHGFWRAVEADAAPASQAFIQQRAREVLAPVRARLVAADTSRSFRVRTTLSRRDPRPTTITARLRHAGANVLLYVDAAAAGPALGGFTDEEYAQLGALFDRELHGIATRTFGATSDLDRNARTLVLFTPQVNRLTASEACGTFVAGFFDARDLTGDATANGAEVLYLAVPGATAGSTCRPLSVDLIRSVAPSTFIHELQHAISYAQHVLQRNGRVESTWLNEGLSHIAEELGGQLYEARYPCPAGPPCSAGRSDPQQLFPDSAQGFLQPNFANAASYLGAPDDFSLTSPTGLGTLEERGASWLFLRWLVDQKGSDILGRLVQTSATGAANVQAVVGEPLPTLMADWLTAVLLDDHPGAAPGAIPPRLQVPSRNLRAIYARLHAINPGEFPAPYPLAVETVGSSRQLGTGGSVVTWSMRPGTFSLFRYESSGANAVVRFGPPEAGRFPRVLRSQLTLIRLP